MDELGNILREARETRGLTIPQVYEQIRITPRYIEALEAGNYEKLPSPVHVRGYLKNYARFLGLDPAPLLERYAQAAKAPPPPRPPSSRTDSRAMEEPLPVRDDQPFFDPVNLELTQVAEPVETGGIVRLVIIVALVVMIGLVAYRFLPMALGSDDPSGSIQSALSGLFGDETPEPTAAAGTGGAPLTVTGEAANETSRSIVTPAVETGQEQVVVEIPTATPTRPSLPATLEEINLRLDISERTWLKITIDGEDQFQGIAVDGEVFEYRALEQAEVSVGNGVGVFVTINGIELGRLGGRGQDYTETWRTTTGG